MKANQSERPKKSKSRRPGVSSGDFLTDEAVVKWPRPLPDSLFMGSAVKRGRRRRRHIPNMLLPLFIFPPIVSGCLLALTGTSDLTSSWQV